MPPRSEKEKTAHYNYSFPPLAIVRTAGQEECQVLINPEEKIDVSRNALASGNGALPLCHTGPRLAPCGSQAKI